MVGSQTVDRLSEIKRKFADSARVINDDDHAWWIVVAETASAFVAEDSWCVTHDDTGACPCGYNQLRAALK